MKNGVAYYSKGKASIAVFFPEKEVKCQYCHFLDYEGWAKRYQCRITQERILQPFETVGWECPLEMEGEDDGDL